MNRPDAVRHIGESATFRDTQPAPQPREARTEPRVPEPVWVQRMREGRLPVKVRWAA